MLEDELTLRDARRIGALLARYQRDLHDAARTHARLLRLLAHLDTPALTRAALVNTDLALALTYAQVARNLTTMGEGEEGEQADRDDQGGERGAA